MIVMKMQIVQIVMDPTLVYVTQGIPVMAPHVWVIFSNIIQAARYLNENPK